MLPSCTMTAPTGTSPLNLASLACTSACCIKSASVEQREARLALRLLLPPRDLACTRTKCWRHDCSTCLQPAMGDAASIGWGRALQSGSQCTTKKNVRHLLQKVTHVCIASPASQSLARCGHRSRRASPLSTLRSESRTSSMWGSESATELDTGSCADT